MDPLPSLQQFRPPPEAVHTTGSVSFFSNVTMFGSAPVQSDGTAYFRPRRWQSQHRYRNGRVWWRQRLYTTTSIDGSGSNCRACAQFVGGAQPLGKIVLPATAIAGARFISRLPLVLSNSGSTLSGKFTVHLYASTSATLDDNAVLLTTVKKNLRLPDERRATVNAVVNALPATLPSGAYYLLVEVIDPTGAMNVSASASTVQVAAPFLALRRLGRSG